MSEKLLEIKDLSIHFSVDDTVIKAVNGVELIINKGETIGLVGETGAGKTTTALGIMQLVPSPPGKILSGEIIFEGNDLCKVSKNDLKKIRGNKISMIFQDPMTALNPVMNVGAQIAEVIKHHEKISTAEANIRAGRMLETVGISSERFNEFPHQFSGGMKQRVVIAIALACNPTLLIADEPTTALDVTIQAQVLDLMAKLKNEFDTSMLLITHDLGVVAEVCDKVGIMYAGEIVEFGTLEDIYESTRHPYTQGLFNSVPNIKDKSDRLKPIQGTMPDPSNLPQGCCFHPRCEYATEECMKKPKMTAENDTHYVKCWNPIINR